MNNKYYEQKTIHSFQIFTSKQAFLLIVFPMNFWSTLKFYIFKYDYHYSETRNAIK